MHIFKILAITLKHFVLTRVLSLDLVVLPQYNHSLLKKNVINCSRLNCFTFYSLKSKLKQGSYYLWIHTNYAY